MYEKRERSQIKIPLSQIPSTSPFIKGKTGTEQRRGIFY
jgi:hypothetical protein